MKVVVSNGCLSNRCFIGERINRCGKRPTWFVFSGDDPTRTQLSNLYANICDKHLPEAIHMQMNIKRKMK